MSCFRRNLWLFGVLVATLLVSAVADEGTPVQHETVHLKVEIERGKEVHRFTVFICNDSEEAFVFETGASGGPGSLDDRKPIGLGTPPNPVIMRFREKVSIVTLTSPTFGGQTRRSLQPAKVTVKPGQRLEYASFAVPASHVVGEFQEVFIQDSTTARNPDFNSLYGGKSSLIEKEPLSK